MVIKLNSKQKKIGEEIYVFLKDNDFVSETDDNFDFNTDLFDYGYLDSFGIVQLILFIEKKYKYDLSDEDFYNKLRTVNNISKKILT